MNRKTKSTSNKSSKKGKVIMSLAVLLLGGAMFGNWYLANNDVKTTLSPILSNEKTTEAKNLGEASYVNATEAKDSEKEDDYFVQSRIDRQQARDNALEELNKILDKDSAGDAAQKTATEKIAVISNNITAENKIESLIKAKEVKNCLAVIGEDGVDVIVQVDELTEPLIMQIKEIVMNQTKTSFEKISIIEVK